MCYVTKKQEKHLSQLYLNNLKLSPCVREPPWSLRSSGFSSIKINGSDSENKMLPEGVMHSAYQFQLKRHPKKTQ